MFVFSRKSREHHYYHNIATGPALIIIHHNNTQTNDQSNSKFFFLFVYLEHYFLFLGESVWEAPEDAPIELVEKMNRMKDIGFANAKALAEDFGKYKKKFMFLNNCLKLFALEKIYLTL